MSGSTASTAMVYTLDSAFATETDLDDAEAMCRTEETPRTPEPMDVSDSPPATQPKHAAPLFSSAEFGFRGETKGGEEKMTSIGSTASYGTPGTSEEGFGSQEYSAASLRFRSNDRLFTGCQGVDSSLEHPVGRGYFVAYAEAARNEENLLYLIAVKQYMQLKTKNQKRDMAKTILQTYCVDHSKLEICIPGSVRPRFVSALKDLQAGKNVNMTNLFAAQALSAQKDALRDLQPRFLAGSFYKRFMRFSALSQAGGIIVPSPQRFADPALIKELHSNGALGTHQVILDYADLYALFLEFCTSRHCEENAMVLMALNGLDEYIRQEDYEQAEALAWHIYHHYVDPSSVHAVTIDEMAIWTFIKHIPKPHSGMWAVLEEQARLGIKSAMTQFMTWNPWRMYVRATALGARGSFRMCSGGRGSSAAVRKRRLSVALGSGHRTTQYMKK